MTGPVMDRNGVRGVPTPDVLMSFHEHWALAILAGTKTVEIRARRPAFPPGTRVWMYATAPRAAVVGWCVVGGIGQFDASRPPRRLMRDAEATPGGLREYLGPASDGWAIEISRRGGMKTVVPLPPSRRAPMSYCYLGETDGRFLRRLKTESKRASPSVLSR